MNAEAIATFPFDDYQFRNIFLQIEINKYQAPSIFIGGTFKQIEEEWGIWLNRLSEFLGNLEAVEANIILDCHSGRFGWTLQPESIAFNVGIFDIESLIGEE